MMVNRTRSKARAGSSLLAVMLIVLSTGAISLGLLVAVRSSAKEQRATRDDLVALYATEAGIAEAVFDLGQGGTGAVGAEDQPVKFATGSSFWVSATDLGGGQTSLRSTGQDGRLITRVEVVVEAVPGGGWSWAAFGDEFMTMDSNARVDSYDSRNGTYASQATNGSGSNQYASASGDVGSNGDVSLDQNATVWGDALPGPGGSTLVLGNAVVTGSITPRLQPEPLPPLTIPALVSVGDVTVSSAQTMPAGDHRFGSLTVANNKVLTITGPATVVADNLSLKAGSQLLIDSTGGPVEFFIVDDFVMSSNTLITSLTNDPADVTLNLESNNIVNPNLNVDLDEIDFNSNAQVFGTIYAPNAEVVINSNFELFGGLLAKRLHLDSNATIHYDEALGSASAGGRPQYRTLCWRLLSNVGP